MNKRRSWPKAFFCKPCNPCKKKGVARPRLAVQRTELCKFPSTSNLLFQYSTHVLMSSNKKTTHQKKNSATVRENTRNIATCKWLPQNGGVNWQASIIIIIRKQHNWLHWKISQLVSLIKGIRLTYTTVCYRINAVRCFLACALHTLQRWSGSCKHGKSALVIRKVDLEQGRIEVAKRWVGQPMQRRRAVPIIKLSHYTCTY